MVIKTISVVSFIILIFVVGYVFYTKENAYEPEHPPKVARWVCNSGAQNYGKVKCILNKNSSLDQGFNTKEACENSGVCIPMYWKCQTPGEPCVLTKEKTNFPDFPHDSGNKVQCERNCSPDVHFKCNMYQNTPLRYGGCSKVDSKFSGETFVCKNKDCSKCAGYTCNNKQYWKCDCNKQPMCQEVGSQDNPDFETDPTDKQTFSKFLNFGSTCKKWIQCNKHNYSCNTVINNKQPNGYSKYTPDWCDKNCTAPPKTLYYWDKNANTCKQHADVPNKPKRSYYDTLDKCFKQNCHINGMMYCKGASRCCNIHKCEGCKNGQCAPSNCSTQKPCSSCISSGECSTFPCSAVFQKVCKPSGCQNMGDCGDRMDFNRLGQPRWFCPNRSKPGWCVDKNDPTQGIIIADNPNNTQPVCQFDHSTKCVYVKGPQQPYQDEKGIWRGSLGCWPLGDMPAKNLPKF